MRCSRSCMATLRMGPVTVRQGLSLGHYVYVLVFFQAMHTPHRVKGGAKPDRGFMVGVRVPQRLRLFLCGLKIQEPLNPASCVQCPWTACSGVHTMHGVLFYLFGVTETAGKKIKGGPHRRCVRRRRTMLNRPTTCWPVWMRAAGPAVRAVASCSSVHTPLPSGYRMHA